MGFGLLLIGFFFACVMSLIPSLYFAMLWGYPMIIIALYRLASYHVRFKYTFFVSFASLPFAVYFSLAALRDWGVEGWLKSFVDSSFSIVEPCYIVFYTFFFFLVLYSIAGLAGELRLLSVQSSAWRNVIVLGFYVLLDLVYRVASPQIAENQLEPYFALPALLLKVAFLLLTVWLIFQCYRKIASEDEDVSMPEFGFKKKKKEKKK